MSQSINSTHTSMSTLHSRAHPHHCSSHDGHDDVYTPPPSPELPSQTFHPSLIPLPAGIIGSAAGGSHYSGAKVYHRKSDVERASAGARDHLIELNEVQKQVLEDLKEVGLVKFCMPVHKRSLTPIPHCPIASLIDLPSAVLLPPIARDIPEEL